MGKQPTADSTCVRVRIILPEVVRVRIRVRVRVRGREV
jgi:hypothetical protein